MKKNTKLLIGAGAALGIGYLLLRKGGTGLKGLGAAPSFTPEELAEFDEFDGFYYSEWGARKDYGDVLAAIAARRGATLTEAQQDAAYYSAVTAGMYAQGFNTAGAADKRAAIIEYYSPFLSKSLTDLGLVGSSSDGGSSGGECPAGQVPAIGIDGKVFCVSSDIGPGTGSSGGGSTGTGTGTGSSGGGSTGTGTGTGTGTPGTGTGTGTGTPKTPPKTDDGGIGIGTIALALAAGGVVWFLLKTDDTKVVKLREQGAEKAREVGSRAAGAASKKLAEYQRRMQNGSGVNGLRRRRNSRR